MRNDGRKPRLVGINHVALEVTDVDAALDFWKTCFGIEPSEREPRAGFLELGDQFIARNPPQLAGSS